MILAKTFVSGVAITDSAEIYYTTPLKTRGLIKNAVFVNDNDTSVTISINIVAYGGTALYTNRIVKDKTLPGNGSWICSALVDQVINPYSSIVMIASVTNKVGCSISGFEIT